MNKFNIRKMFITLGLSGTMVQASGCSTEKEEVLPSKTIETEVDATEEKEIDFLEPTMKPVDTNNRKETEGDIHISPSKEKKETKEEQRKRLFREIKKSKFDSLTKDILKNIANGCKEERTKQQLSIACRESNKKLRTMWLYDTILEATREQEKIGEDYYAYYPLKKMKILYNLDGRKKELPKDIGIMVNLSTFGNYKFYEKVAGNEFCFLVADKEDRVLLVASDDKVVKTENYPLQSLENVLEKYGIATEKIYKSENLLDDVLVSLSIKMNESTIGNLQTIKTNDIVVLDSSTLMDSEDYHNRYYFLKYRCPYLFDSKMPKIYTDIFNLDASAVIGQSVTFYKDCDKACMWDTFTPLGHEVSYFSLNDFLKNQNVSVKEQISYQELKRINKKVNQKEGKVLKKKK